MCYFLDLSGSVFFDLSVPDAVVVVVEELTVVVDGAFAVVVEELTVVAGGAFAVVVDVVTTGDGGSLMMSGFCLGL